VGRRARADHKVSGRQLQLADPRFLMTRLAIQRAVAVASVPTMAVGVGIVLAGVGVSPWLLAVGIGVLAGASVGGCSP